MISISTAVLAHNMQVNHEELGAVIGAVGKTFTLSEALGGANLSERVATLANAEVSRQAMMIAYIDDFWMLMWLMIAMIPLALLVEPFRAGKAHAAAAVAAD